MEKKKTLACLKTGKVKVVGQFTWGSNFAFLVDVQNGTEKIEAVYKPQRGERPLWDFPEDTLAKREVAAFLVSEALGWDLVPPTAFREDGPLGPGSLQQRVDHDPEIHYFTFDAATRQRLRPVALFDLIVNNADRKGGHILIDGDDKIRLIDHGICFHAEPKLRTVVWDFVDEEILDSLIKDIKSLKAKVQSGLKKNLSLYLAEDEISALDGRITELLANPVFPAQPEGERATPWPLI